MLKFLTLKNYLLQVLVILAKLLSSPNLTVLSFKS